MLPEATLKKKWKKTPKTKPKIYIQVFAFFYL